MYGPASEDAVLFCSHLSGSLLTGHGPAEMCMRSESMFGFLDETSRNEPLEGSGWKGCGVRGPWVRIPALLTSESS